MSIAAIISRSSMTSYRRLPISARHAFALAFDLAVRRDFLQSLAVPLLLRSPWILALALLPPITQTDRPAEVMLLTIAAMLGDFVMLLTVGAMLRFRARSVFNTPREVRPAPVVECYARGLKRVPWLIVTEIVRNLTLFFSAFFFVVPAVLFGFRLACATESVVLDESHTAAAFRRSYHLTQGRFERWLEMVVISVVFMVSIIFLFAVFSLLIPASITTWVSVTLFAITAVAPVIVYAWTFFYLRLIEIEMGTEVGPAYAHASSAPIPPPDHALAPALHETPAPSPPLVFTPPANGFPGEGGAA